MENEEEFTCEWCKEVLPITDKSISATDIYDYSICNGCFSDGFGDCSY